MTSNWVLCRAPAPPPPSENPPPPPRRGGSAPQRNSIHVSIQPRFYLYCTMYIVHTIYYVYIHTYINYYLLETWLSEFMYTSNPVTKPLPPNNNLLLKHNSNTCILTLYLSEQRITILTFVLFSGYAAASSHVQWLVYSYLLLLVYS